MIIFREFYNYIHVNDKELENIAILKKDKTIPEAPRTRISIQKFCIVFCF